MIRRDRPLTERVIRALQLDSNLFEEVEQDRNATSQALTVVVIAAISSGIASLLRLDIVTALLAVPLAFVAWALGSYLAYVVGTSLFKVRETRTSWGECLRVLGFAQAPGIFSFITFVPILGGLAAFIIGIWSFIAGVIGIRQAMEFSTLRAVGTVIVSAIVQAIVLGILFLIF